MDSNLLSSVEQLQTAVELIMNPQTPSHLRREASDVSSSGVKQSSPTKHRIGRIDFMGYRMSFILFIFLHLGKSFYGATVDLALNRMAKWVEFSCLLDSPKVRYSKNHIICQD